MTSRELDIHPTAVVAAGAVIGRRVVIGPYAVIEDPVVIGHDTVIGAHAVIHGFTRLGARNRISAHAVIGGLPQDLSFKPGDAGTWVEIGDDNVVREGVTIHRATRPEAATRIGSGCYLMAYSHVGHDCDVADHVVVANNCMLGGHARIGEGATLGGNSGVHQFVRVGALAMVAGYIAVRRDVLPYSLVAGEPVRHYRLNAVGLRRAGIHGERYRALERAFRALRAGAASVDRDTPELAVLAHWLEQPSQRGVYGFAGAGRFVPRSDPGDDRERSASASKSHPGEQVMYHEKVVLHRYGRTPDEHEHAVNYLKLLKLILSDDGELPRGRKAALDRLMDQLGIAEPVQKQVHDFSARDVTPTDIVPALRPGGQLSRLLIRDAVELLADRGGYSGNDRDVVARAAEALGVDGATVVAIESLVDIERGARTLHRALFHTPAE